MVPGEVPAAPPRLSLSTVFPGRHVPAAAPPPKEQASGGATFSLSLPVLCSLSVSPPSLLPPSLPCTCPLQSPCTTPPPGGPTCPALKEQETAAYRGCASRRSLLGAGLSLRQVGARRRPWRPEAESPSRKWGADRCPPPLTGLLGFPFCFWVGPSGFCAALAVMGPSEASFGRLGPARLARDASPFFFGLGLLAGSLDPYWAHRQSAWF